jgi:hypothetical protein
VSIYLARTVPEDIVGAAASEYGLSCYLYLLLELVPWDIVGAVVMLLLELLLWGSDEIITPGHCCNCFYEVSLEQLPDVLFSLSTKVVLMLHWFVAEAVTLIVLELPP